MEIAVVTASMLVVILAYLHVSVLDRSLVNVLTPVCAVFLPANYLVELLWLSYGRPAGTLYAYLLSYGSYAALFVAMALGYSLRVRRVNLPLSARTTDGPSIIAWCVFAAAWILYLPVLLKFRAHIANPREIYELSRFGYGQYYFLSTMLCYFAVVLLLYSRAGGIQRLLFLVLSLLFMYLHGSKHHMLVPFFIFAVWWVYARGRTVSLLGFTLFALVMCALGLGVFMLTNPVLLLYGVEGLVGYSDYTHNGMLVIDAGKGPLFGSLSVETELFTRLPRILFPGKPIAFGDVRLSEQFFPAQFNAGHGAASVGFGGLFADYGVATVPILALFGFLKGVLLRVFSNNVRAGGSPGDFILLMFGAGISLIPLSGVILLPEHVVLAIAANCLFGLVLLRSGERRVLSGVAK